MSLQALNIEKLVPLLYICFIFIKLYFQQTVKDKAKKLNYDIQAVASTAFS